MLDLAIVTCAKYPNLGSDGEALLEAVAKAGLTARPVIWDDPDFDWSSTKFALIHSTWDYHHRREEFLAWAGHTAKLTRLWNPVEVLRWNTQKLYLREFEAQGVRLIPTIWLDKPAKVDLADLLLEYGWETAVIKPIVSASAFGTMLVTPSVIAKAQIHFEELLARGEVMVQPYLSSLADYGERCLTYIDGDITHATRRPSALQENGERIAMATHLIPATPDELEFAANVLNHLKEPILYGRIDLVRDDVGNICLMELELTEPGMFFRHNPTSAEKLAFAIRKIISFS
jgi:hypothetical protein